MLRAAAAVLLAQTAWADTIHLKNGNQLEGLIAKETRAEIVLDLGFGTMSLQRSDVARIQRSSPKGRAELKRIHRHKFFDSGRWVPSEYKDLFARYQELGAAREAAREARGRRDALLEEQSDLVQEMPRLDGQARYDSIRRLREIDTLLPFAERDMQAYLTRFKAFEEAAAAAPEAASPEAREFRERLAQAQAEMAAEFDKDEIVSRREGSHLIVQAMLDGKVPATFLVDTGASLTTISPQVAARLSPLAGSEALGVSTLADGRRTQVKTFEVGAIEIGRSRQSRVRVAVMPTPGPSVDGLLGMSFLEHFAVQVDVPAGKLLLNRMK